MNDHGVKESWDRHITDWERDIWPVMDKHDITKSAAFVAWMLHRVEQSMSKMAGDNRNPDDETWRGGRRE